MSSVMLRLQATRERPGPVGLRDVVPRVDEDTQFFGGQTVVVVNGVA